MTDWWQVARTGGAVTGAAGLAAAGAAVGLASERYVVGRSLRGKDPYADEGFGGLRGTPYVVLASDGVELHVEVDELRGTPEPPVTVVFTHGYALNLDVWHFQRKGLAGLARLVLWDHRSHGRSGRSAEENVSMDWLARDLEHVIEALAPQGPVVLVGHSMGGMTTMELAHRRPDLFGDRVTGIGLIATSAGGMTDVTLGVPGPAGRTAHRLAPRVVGTLARQPAVVERTRRVGSDLGYVLTKRYSFGPGVPPSLVEFTADLNAATPIGVISDFLPMFDEHDAIGVLHRFGSCHALVVGAGLDQLTPVTHARRIAHRLPHADFVEVPDAGHMVLLERHALVTAHLRTLIERAATGPRT